MLKDDKKIVRIYMQLLDEGTPTIRWVNAEVLGENIYLVLPFSGGQETDARGIPTDEKWAFPPGSKVKCRMETWDVWVRGGEDYLVAYEQIKD